MTDLGLLWACSVAFAAVFTLLTVLAVVMHLVTIAFPERRTTLDPAVSAAISTTVAALFPGARVTRIEEEDR